MYHDIASVPVCKLEPDAPPILGNLIQVPAETVEMFGRGRIGVFLVKEIVNTYRDFQILGEIKDVETIAAGQGVHIRRYLERIYGKGRWRKMKGTAIVRLPDGFVCTAEVHWFEAHGIGRKDFKIKRILP